MKNEIIITDIDLIKLVNQIGSKSLVGLLKKNEDVRRFNLEIPDNISLDDFVKDLRKFADSLESVGKDE